MKVTVIDYTGAGSTDQDYAAKLLIYTKSTRLEQGADTRSKVFSMSKDDILKELDYISKTIRSSWEFVDYTFEIKDVTRAFTHQLVRTRTASYAQQAQRVVDMSDFEDLMPATVSANAETAALWRTHRIATMKMYKSLQDKGIPNQDCRGILPTNVLTNIIMKANLRTIADLLAKRKNIRAQGEYADVAREMEKRVLEIHPWTEQFLNPDRLRTPGIDRLLKEAIGPKGPLDAPPHVNEAAKELDALKGTWG